MGRPGGSVSFILERGPARNPQPREPSTQRCVRTLEAAGDRACPSSSKPPWPVARGHALPRVRFRSSHVCINHADRTGSESPLGSLGALGARRGRRGASRPPPHPRALGIVPLSQLWAVCKENQCEHGLRAQQTHSRAHPLSLPLPPNSPPGSQLLVSFQKLLPNTLGVCVCARVCVSTSPA